MANNGKNTKIGNETILDTSFRSALSERYLAYALSTIKARSLPDVRDGLKPVHRRLLYAMRQLRLDPETMPKKSARVVGDVIGKYHPHGDMSVYEALVRLAQDFSSRYPLVDGQGNFGNVDGDNAAAMRYTEAKLTQVAKLLLEGLDDNAVDFRPTYDGDGDEPVVMPANFPNLLANGSTGIAVGMATSIPPHNVYEIAKALRILLKNAGATTRELMSVFKGPDFPLGGTLVEDFETILNAYETGRGSFRVRAKWEKEDLGQGTWQIVVTEIPYMVQKSKLIEKIADLLMDKKIPILDDIRDESAEDIRIVLVPKSRNVDPEVLMSLLFKNSDLESRFNLNLNVIDHHNIPHLMSLPQVLQHYIDHRNQVLVRRSQFRLEKIQHRLEILDGFLIAYLNLDRVIQIIRFEDDPKAVLMAEFSLTEIQTDAILNMRLKALHKLEEFEIRKEHQSLSDEKKALESLLANKSEQVAFLDNEFTILADLFSPKTALGKRRTIIEGAPQEIDMPVEAMIEKEAITVLCSEKGWIRSVKGHLTDAAIAETKYKEGDGQAYVIKCESIDKLLLLNSDGRMYTLLVDRIPRGRGFGEPLTLLCDFQDSAKIVNILPYEKDAHYVIASTDGRGFQVYGDNLVASTKTGRQILTLADKAKAKIFVKSDGDHIAVIGNNRKLLIFPIDQLPILNKGRGVTLQKYKDGSLSDLQVIKKDEGMKFNYGTSGRVQTDLVGWLGNRAGQGKMPPNGFPRNNKF